MKTLTPKDAEVIRAALDLADDVFAQLQSGGAPTETERAAAAYAVRIARDLDVMDIYDNDTVLCPGCKRAGCTCYVCTTARPLPGAVCTCTHFGRPA